MWQLWWNWTEGPLCSVRLGFYWVLLSAGPSRSSQTPAFLAARGIAHDDRRGGEETDRRNTGSFRSRWCWGSFGAALSRMELLKLPPSFDWPVAVRYHGPNTKLGIAVTAV